MYTKSMYKKKWNCGEGERGGEGDVALSSQAPPIVVRIHLTGEEHVNRLLPVRETRK